MSKVQTIDASGREKVSDSKCNWLRLRIYAETILLKFFRKDPESPLTGEPFQDSFVLRRSQV